jgi:ferredoxin
MPPRKNLFTRVLSPSTREFVRQSRSVPGNTHYSFLDFLHGYIYARWPYLYIGIGVGEHPLARRFGTLYARLTRKEPPVQARYGAIKEPQDLAPSSLADNYHGKVVPLEAASQLVMVNEPVEILELEQVIPYKKARDIVLQNPEHIVALECPCRSSRSEPCLPLDVCLIVGEPFASFVLEHHVQRSRRITQAEAVQILKEEDERGHVHHAFFKDAMLGRFYAICNCCSCCCGAMQAWRNGTPMLASSGYVSRVNAERCIGCGACAGSCPFDAIHVGEGVATVDGARCLGCGVCVSRCQQDALSLARDPDKSEPLEIRKLVASGATD